MNLPGWLLPIFIFAVWALWVIAACGENAVRQARRGLPSGQRGGISILPVMPVFPLAFWGIAVLVDCFAAPWGSRVIGSLHGLYGIVLVVSIVWYWFQLRVLDRDLRERTEPPGLHR